MITETNIANRALQRLGQPRIASNSNLWDEDSKGASELRDCWDIVRRTELRRNVWRFSIRTQVLRPIDEDTYIITFQDWDARFNYAVNEIVWADGTLWICKVGGINHDPADRDFVYWDSYFGNELAFPYDDTTTWMAGELVYDVDDADTNGNGIYMSLQNNNEGNALSDTAFWQLITSPEWDSGTAYVAGDRVQVANVAYVSILAGTNYTPPNATYWVAINDPTVALLKFIYPIGAGPTSSTQTRNAYRLPYGWVREAPQAPKQGSYLPLGAPAALPYSDWQYEGNYFTTMSTGAIAYRFASDQENPEAMDPLFVDGFSCRLALETCEALTQKTEKLSSISALYSKFMSEARIVNGIETGPTEPPEDQYITSRY